LEFWENRENVAFWSVLEWWVGNTYRSEMDGRGGGVGTESVSEFADFNNSNYAFTGVYNDIDREGEER